MAALLAVCLGACADGGGPGPTRPAPAGVGLETIATGLEDPVYLTAPPGDTSRVFVLKKPGRIRLIENDSLRSTPFLDLSSLVESGSLEQGLLGMAFDPNYASTGRFYVCYTGRDGDTRLARWRVSADPDRAMTTADRVLLTVPVSEVRHLGGMIAFGPDGYLYLSTGDGAQSSSYRGGTAQDPTDLLGSILRIDVSGAGDYTIPADNPAASPARREVWCFGLRNPWRFSFDRFNGDLYVADVGEGSFEEVNVLRAATGRGRGANLGWALYEGTSCRLVSACADPGLTPPTHVYDHGQGCTVIGGFVYRGSAFPSLAGSYFFGDYCGGWVRSFRYVSGAVGPLVEWEELRPGGSITSFGEDAAGELYVLTMEGGVFRFRPE